MKFKRLSAAALAIAMTASSACFAAGEESHASDLQTLFGSYTSGYETVITINGEKVEACDYSYDTPGWGSTTVSVKTEELPAAPAGYVPMRAIAQADHGMAYWSKEENMSWFRMGDIQIDVYFDDMSVQVEEETLEGVSALLISGVTYLPASVFGSLEGFSLTDNSAQGVESYEIGTPNGAPLMRTAYQIMEDSAMLGGMRQSLTQMEEWYGENMGFKAEFATEGVAFLPTITFPDTLVLGKMAQGKEAELRESLEAYRASQEQTFSWYLGQHLPKVQNAQFVTEGDWFLFLIAEDVEAGVAAFRAAVQAMEE